MYVALMNRGHIRHRHALSFCSALSFWEIFLCFSKTHEHQMVTSVQRINILLCFSSHQLHSSNSIFNAFIFWSSSFFFANPPPLAFLFSPISTWVTYLFAHKKMRASCAQSRCDFCILFNGLFHVYILVTLFALPVFFFAVFGTKGKMKNDWNRNKNK